jgi:hypothetical protein
LRYNAPTHVLIHKCAMTSPTRHLRQACLATLAASLVAALFWVFFNASKHWPSLAAVNIFAEDPYDAAGSFGIQLAGLAALLSLVRSLRPEPQGPTLARLALILRGNVVVLLAAAVTLLADGLALLRYADRWTASIVGWWLAGWVGGLMALTLLVGWCSPWGGGWDWPQGGVHGAVRP